MTSEIGQHRTVVDRGRHRDRKSKSPLLPRTRHREGHRHPHRPRHHHHGQHASLTSANTANPPDEVPCQTVNPAAPARHADLRHARRKPTTPSNQKQELPTTSQTSKAHGIASRLPRTRRCHTGTRARRGCQRRPFFTRCRQPPEDRLPPAYPLACQPSRYPPARLGMTHRDGQSSRRRVSKAPISPTRRSRTVRCKCHARRPYQPFQRAAHPMARKGVTGPADQRLLQGWLVVPAYAVFGTKRPPVQIRPPRQGNGRLQGI